MTLSSLASLTILLMFFFITSALQDKANDLNKQIIEDESKVSSSLTKMNTITTGLAMWAGIVTIALIVIVALVFRRLRRRQSWKNLGAESVYSDAESAMSKSDKSSVVDVDSLSIAPSLPEHDNGAFLEDDPKDLRPHKPVVLHRELDTELNGHTIGALANMDDCDEDDFDTASSITAPSIASSDTPRFSHATYRGISLGDNKKNGGASFL